MNKYISSSATVGVWAPGAWSLELDVFILSCFPAFLILISVPVFPSFPSVFKGGSSVTLVTLVHGRPKKAKLPNEPNSKVQIPLLNTGDFPFSPVFETGKKMGKKASISRYLRVIYRSKTAILRLCAPTKPWWRRFVAAMEGQKIKNNNSAVPIRPIHG
jgi:hypothetical protein